MNLSKISTMKNINQANKVYIPIRFYKEIKLHIFKNYYANKYHEFETPLILAISGPPGVGKTYQVEKTLEEMGIEKFNISGTEFENEHAGVPVKNILKIYKNMAEDIYFKKIKYGVIIINDIDAALGSWGGLVQYTMNRQLIIKALIDLADNPYELKISDEDGHMQHYDMCRIPLIITLNDETKMYEPLMRNGRTKVFPWLPNEEEVSYILTNIFRNIEFIDANGFCIPVFELYRQLLKYVSNLMGENINVLPISIFSDIKSSLIDNLLWDELCKNDSLDMIAEKLRRKLDIRQKYTFSEALTVGQNLLHQNNNYLRDEYSGVAKPPVRSIESQCSDGTEPL